jgi:hypothetical protein
MKTNNDYSILKGWLIILLIGKSLCGSAQEEYCCERNFIFPEFPMPAEQERDISGYISGAWNSYILKDGAHENEACPIKIALLSYSGTIDLEHMVEKISSVAQKKVPKQDSNSENVKKNAEYVWKGQLELTYIEKIIPGKTEEAYGGGTEYVPGYVIGGWKFTVKLYDIQHDEVVKEASTTWTGSDIAFYKNLKDQYKEGKSDKLYIDILEELYDREFGNLKQIIIDYEKAPKKAEFKSKEIKVNPEQIEKITFKVTDEKGEVPKSWQRLAVRIEFGSLTNGTPCCYADEDFKTYSFYCENGNISLDYKAPEGEKATFDHIPVFNGCATKDEAYHPKHWVDPKAIIGELDLILINEGYSGTITITKSWDYTKHHDDYTSTYTGTQTITVSGAFKPIPEMEGMEGQPIKIFGKGTAHGTWKHNEQRYCEGSGCSCKGLVYEEYGSGSLNKYTMDGIMIMTNVWPTDNKIVADQLSQFGMENWYDIMIPGEAVPTQNRTRYDTKDAGCQWDNSNSTAELTDCSIRYKLTDIKRLQDKVSWSSKSESTGVSVTNLTEAVYDQKPFDPEQDGSDFTYTITWNLSEL